MINRSKAGLTIVEALVVISTSLALLWVIVPVVLVRYGYKEAGVMVVTEGIGTQGSGTDDVLESRIKGLNKTQVIESSSRVKEAPTVPAKSIFNE